MRLTNYIVGEMQYLAMLKVEESLKIPGRGSRRANDYQNLISSSLTIDFIIRHFHEDPFGSF